MSISDFPDHVCMEKRATIAATMDGLGDKFKPELCSGWLAYIRETYPNGPVAAADLTWPDHREDGLLELVVWVPDALILFGCMLTDPLWWMCQLASFLQ